MVSPVVDLAPSLGGRCRLLAFDTATELTSLAVLTPRGVRSRVDAGGAQASTALVPALLAMLADAGLSLRDLDAIAYGCGPGAFTGLRTACAVAQGLAYGVDKPVLAVDSLMLVAESVRAEALARGAATVWVAQDARMDEVYAAAYRWQGERSDRWQTAVAPALYTIDALNRRWADEDWAGGAVLPAGSALAVMGPRLVTGGVVWLDVDAGIGRASALAALAASHWQDDRGRDAAEALPVYLRDKVALTTAEREAARSAKEAA